MAKRDVTGEATISVATPAEIAETQTSSDATASEPEGVIDGPTGPDGPTKEWTLPSGQRATFLRKLTGKHMLAAQRATNGDMHAMSYAMIAQGCTIDGKSVTFEDVLALNYYDVQDLMKTGLPDKPKGKASPS